MLRKLTFVIVILLVLCSSLAFAVGSHTAIEYVGWIDKDIEKFERLNIDASALLPLKEIFAELTTLEGGCGIGCFYHDEQLLEDAIKEYDGVMSVLSATPKWQEYKKMRREEYQKNEQQNRIEAKRKRALESDKYRFAMNSAFTYLFFDIERDILKRRGIDTSEMSERMKVFPEKFKSVVSISNPEEYYNAQEELIEFYYGMGREAKKHDENLRCEAGTVLQETRMKYLGKNMDVFNDMRIALYGQE